MNYKVLFVFAALFTGCSNTQTQITSSTVMVTNLNQNSGGSGTIVKSQKDRSYVLTNAHVCGVVGAGGVVKTTSGLTYAVVGYRVSETHDLCLISVAADLHQNATIPSTPPQMYDKAIISGHPKLYPNVITTGHFSGKSIIQVMTGFRACTEAERLDPSTAPFCFLVGKIPVVKAYESILVTATIQPGSSGSGIYNEDGQLSAVVFAGSGDLAYSFSVPSEYVNFFLKYEAKTLTEKSPDMVLNFTSNEMSRKDYIKAVSKVCTSETLTEKAKVICSIFERDLIMYQ